ncbi:MAG: VWA domain-containing protein [Balneolaceae bacterium]|nr:MAG: VWA domain-containing protein [Balneolaceae bacterium]
MRPELIYIWADPGYLWLLTLIPLYLAYRVWISLSRRVSSLTFSSSIDLKSLPFDPLSYLPLLTPLLYSFAAAFIILALARPQNENATVERLSEGIDIMISIDISSSMLAEDIKPNRLIAAKDVAAEFIRQRNSDRIGINVFARESFTVVPPTLDHLLVLRLLETVDLGMVRDGTAIGMGIATSLNRLRDSNAESRVLILLTDGMNNSGEIDPVTAGEMAAALGVKIYSIGIGSRGTAPYPIDDPIFGRRYQNVEVNIDEEMLIQISGATGGQYRRATDLDELIEIYREIDSLEQSVIDEIIYLDREDLYMNYLIWALSFLFIAWLNERYLARSPVLAGYH